MEIVDAFCPVGERRIRVQSALESAGYPVLVHHGTPGSRLLFGPQVDEAAKRGVRLISWDRPGYSDTPGRPGRRVADAAFEANALADYLELGRFATWGFSGGGPFALACAAFVPDRVSAAVVMATLAPYDAPELEWAGGFPPQVQTEIELLFTDPAAHRKMHSEVAAAWASSLSRPESWFARWKEAAGQDQAHSRAMAEYLALDFQEALLLDDEGWFEDDVAFLTPWGVDVANIDVPVQLWHGEDDTSVPVEHGRWLASHIPSVDAHFVEGDHATIETAHQEEAWDWLLGRSTP